MLQSTCCRVLAVYLRVSASLIHQRGKTGSTASLIALSLFAWLFVAGAGAISTSSHGPTCSPVHSSVLESVVSDGGVHGNGMARLYGEATHGSATHGSATHGQVTHQQAPPPPPQGQQGHQGQQQQAPQQQQQLQVIDNCHRSNIKVPLEVECMSPPSCTLSPYGSPDSLPSSPHTSASSTSCDSPISSDMDTCSPLSPLSTSSSSIPATTSAARTANHIHLWQFLKELLSQPQLYGSSIRWLDRTSGVFKIEDSVKVARLWGKRKNRPAMNYDKLSRSIRQYYKKGIMRKTERSQRLVYQFCHPYSHWRVIKEEQREKKTKKKTENRMHTFLHFV